MGLTQYDLNSRRVDPIKRLAKQFCHGDQRRRACPECQGTQLACDDGAVYTMASRKVIARSEQNSRCVVPMNSH
jgi:hypothetical protein